MSKSVLTIDTPEHCYLCTCYTEDEGDGYCLGITAKRVPTEGKPSWCPLKPYKKVNAIPIEWIKNWCVKNYPTYPRIITEQLLKKTETWRMIEDWEKENE